MPQAFRVIVPNDILEKHLNPAAPMSERPLTPLMKLPATASLRQRLRDLTLLSASTLLGISPGSLHAQVTPPAVEAPSTVDGSTVFLDQYIVTGVTGPRRQLETPLSVTVLNSNQILQEAPRSTAELLKAVPGLYVESSGGEAHNNIFPRGVFSSGGYRYTALLEDGLPVIAESELQFTSADDFTRISNWISRVEALRGGTSGLFTTSAAINTVNFISREGTQEGKGEIELQIGDYGLLRNDIWVSGPFSKDTTYAIGGFYRVDDGIRDPGYTANRGGQIAGNVVHSFPENRGHLKVSFKFLDDRTMLMLPIPLTGTLKNPMSIAGGPSLKDGASSSNDIRITRMPANATGLHDIDLADGIQSKVFYIGTEFQLNFGEGFRLENRNRFTHINKSWNANPFGTATPFQSIANNLANSGNTTAGQYAAALGTGGNYAFRLTEVSTGRIVAANATAAANLNGNGLGVIDQIWSTSSEFDNFQDDLRLIKAFNNEQTTITLGGYYSLLKNKIFWEGVNALLDVNDDFRRLDLTFLDATTGADIGTYTYNGLTNIGSFNFRDVDTEEKDISVYFNAEHKIGALTLDGGVRYTHLAYDWSQTGTVNTDLNAPGGTIPALRNVALYSGPTTAGSVTNSGATSTVGANYQFTNRFAMFGRYSLSPRFHSADQALGFQDRATMLRLGNSNPIEKVRQYELGLKFASNQAGLYVTAFQMEQSNLTNNDFTIDPVTGLAVNTTRLIGLRSRGVEVEGQWSPLKGLRLDLRGVIQDPKIRSGSVQNPVTGEPLSLIGNTPTRVPKKYGSVGASYTFSETTYGILSVNGSYKFTGKRPAALDNVASIGAYSEVSAGVSFAARNRFTYRVQVQNLLDQEGLTEGDPRTSQSVSSAGAYFNARPIFPRSIVGSVSYAF